MPFDTSYNITKNDPHQTQTIVISGGKDTVINVPQQEFDGFIKKHPELQLIFNNLEQDQSTQYPSYLQETEKAEKDFKTSITIIETMVLLTIIIIAFSVKRNWPVWKNKWKKFTATQIVYILFAVLLTYFSFAGNQLLAWPALAFVLIVAGEFRNELFYPGRLNTTEEPVLTDENSVASEKAPLIYEGSSLHFSDTEIENALIKRFPYYKAITDENKERFVYRLKKFLASKTFFIHDESGFKEMPILISASAIQLTFGFKKYLLPYFKNIHVFPEEFYRSNDLGVCFLAGNVSGNNINLSWKHFLHGYQDGSDGQNVGLHELAHALYYQALVVNKGIDENFTASYDQFANHGNKVYDIEMNPQGGLYTEYANKNFQEFWAESAEIFFERPQQLKDLYPYLYETLKDLFNQDPLNLQHLPIG